MMQVKWDKTYLYGVLKSTTQSFEDNTTNEYEDSQDGFAAWIQLKKLYAHGGAPDIKVDELEALIVVPFVPRRKKMVLYLDEFERMGTQLSCLSPNDWTEIRKKKLLKKKTCFHQVQC